MAVSAEAHGFSLAGNFPGSWAFQNQNVRMQYNQLLCPNYPFADLKVE